MRGKAFEAGGEASAKARQSMAASGNCELSGCAAYRVCVRTGVAANDPKIESGQVWG